MTPKAAATTIAAEIWAAKPLLLSHWLLPHLPAAHYSDTACSHPCGSTPSEATLWHSGYYYSLAFHFLWLLKPPGHFPAPLLTGTGHSAVLAAVWSPWLLLLSLCYQLY